MRALFRGLCDLLWPLGSTCCLCNVSVTGGSDPVPICDKCLAAGAFPRDLSLCQCCCRPMDRPWDICMECALGVPFDGVVALGLHELPLTQAIRLLKYQRRPQVARPLGRALAGRVRERWPKMQFEAIVPMPLHRSRLAERGYNQARELAQTLAEQLDTPLQPRWLRRVRSTRQQARLAREHRLRNLEDAFRARVPLLQRGCVLLVDDVLTTGATVCAAARALKEAGAWRVAVAVVTVSKLPVWTIGGQAKK